MEKILNAISQYRSKEIDLHTLRAWVIPFAIDLERKLGYENHDFQTDLDNWFEFIEAAYKPEERYDLTLSLINFIEDLINYEPKPILLPRDDKVIKEYFIKDVDKIIKSNIIFQLFIGIILIIGYHPISLVLIFLKAIIHIPVLVLTKNSTSNKKKTRLAVGIALDIFICVIFMFFSFSVFLLSSWGSQKAMTNGIVVLLTIIVNIMGSIYYMVNASKLKIS